jgi:hypothetical protein
MDRFLTRVPSLSPCVPSGSRGSLAIWLEEAIEGRSSGYDSIHVPGKIAGVRIR